MGNSSTIDISLRKDYGKIPFYRRLRVRLLLLIALCVFITEILVFMPSLINMRKDWLNEHHRALQAISLILQNNPQIPFEAMDEILRKYNIFELSLERNGERQILVKQEYTPTNNTYIDLKTFHETIALYTSIRTLFSQNNAIMTLRGPISGSDVFLNVVMPEQPLRDAMIDFVLRFLLISLTIAVLAATFIYLIIYKFLVCPLQNIYMNLLAFLMEPDNPSKILMPEQRLDEVGATQKRIAVIESALQKNYVRQKHLANLGLAIAKTNHDMRNVLASAQLISDHLSQVKDPMVRNLATKLVKAIDRAIEYSQSVITYGRTQESSPKREHVALRKLIDEVHDTLATDSVEYVQFENLVPETIMIDADREKLHRVLSNLFNNSIQAMTERGIEDDGLQNLLTIRAGRIGTSTIIDVEDTGPGLPLRARDNLFKPFQGSTRRNGSGLGLAICEELIRAHGGTIKLLEDGKSGAHFEIRIPDTPSSLNAWRKEQVVLSA